MKCRTYTICVTGCSGDPPVLMAEAKKLKRLGWEPKFTDLRAIVHTVWRWHNAAFDLVPSSQNRII